MSAQPPPLSAASEALIKTARLLVRITERPLDVMEATNFAQDDSCGAVSIFVGTTRDTFQGKKVLRLEYEAYTPMAVKEMEKLGQLLLGAPYLARKAALVHRVGLVPVGEASVVIAVSAPHRKEGIDAMRFAIDELKATVPIWKKEVYDDGETSWKANCECGWSNKSAAERSSIGKVESSPALETVQSDSHDPHGHHHHHHHHPHH